MLSLAVFLASAAAFLALPRVGFGFFLKGRGGLTLTGFSERVKLGGHGVLEERRHDRDARRGRFQDRRPRRTRAALARHRVRRVLARRVARHRRDAPTRNDTVDYPRAGIERHMLAWTNAQLNSSPRSIEEVAIRQDVWLEPLDSDVMFGASNPRLFEVPAAAPPAEADAQRRAPARSTRTRSTTRCGRRSRCRAVVRAARGPNTLPPAPSATTACISRSRRRSRSARASSPRRSPSARPTTTTKRRRSSTWLDANTSYTLELKEPGSQEPIDFFLFDRKQGHCEYYASAFAILARLNGIPTRQVNGFFGGEWNEYQGYVAVRAGDAHSWDEVYFPGKGWVTFDPTPPDRTRSARSRRQRLARADGAVHGHRAVPVDEVGDRVRPRRAALAVQGHRLGDQARRDRAARC